MTSTGRDDDAVHAECVRIARRLAARADLKIIGFLPASEDVVVPPVARDLGSALIELTGSSVAMVDADPAAQRTGEALPALARLLVDGVDFFRHVLVDLTGFGRRGEQASAAACMDGVVVVGSAHHTREGQILRHADEMPPDRFLGVLLVG